MDSFPHHYCVSTSATPAGPLDNSNEDGLQLLSAPPRQFGGDGDHWSPEHLLTASLSSCLILTFRAVAAARRLPWQAIDCQVDATLDRVEGVMGFTHFAVRVRLVAPETQHEKAQSAVEKAKANCLVSNSLKADIVLQVELVDSF
jgi:organic hydroperoxide reductase OsmC/OhrA